MPRIEHAITDYLDHLLIERGLASNTVTAYRRGLARFSDYSSHAGVTTVEGVTAELIEAFRDALCEGDPSLEWAPVSLSTVAHTIVTVRGFFSFAAQEGWREDNPASTVTPPRIGVRLPKALPVDTVIALLEGAGDGSSADPVIALRDRAVLELLYSTGARVSEIVGLNYGDVNVEHSIAVLHGKGGKDRIVPVGGPARDFYCEYLTRSRPALAKKPTSAVFLNKLGRRLSRQSVWAILQNAAQRGGVKEPVSPHTLRHSCGTHMLEGGASIREVQELLGHSSVTTTEIYTKVTAESLREVWNEAHPRSR